VENTEDGLYADGYYDRGFMENGVPVVPSGGKYTVRWNFGGFTFPTTPAISDERVLIASSGTLFFNPQNNASLFFPAIGKSVTTHELNITGIGEEGGYWTSTAYSIRNGNIPGHASYLDFAIWKVVGTTPVQPQVYMKADEGAFHMAIRCVREVD